MEDLDISRLCISEDSPRDPRAALPLILALSPRGRSLDIALVQEALSPQPRWTLDGRIHLELTIPLDAPSRLLADKSWRTWKALEEQGLVKLSHAGGSIKARPTREGFAWREHTLDHAERTTWLVQALLIVLHGAPRDMCHEPQHKSMAQALANLFSDLVLPDTLHMEHLRTLTSQTPDLLHSLIALSEHGPSEMQATLVDFIWEQATLLDDAELLASAARRCSAWLTAHNDLVTAQHILDEAQRHLRPERSSLRASARILDLWIAAASVALQLDCPSRALSLLSRVERGLCALASGADPFTSLDPTAPGARCTTPDILTHMAPLTHQVHARHTLALARVLRWTGSFPAALALAHALPPAQRDPDFAQALAYEEASLHLELADFDTAAQIAASHLDLDGGGSSNTNTNNIPWHLVLAEAHLRAGRARDADAVLMSLAAPTTATMHLDARLHLHVLHAQLAFRETDWAGALHWFSLALELLGQHGRLEEPLARILGASKEWCLARQMPATEVLDGARVSINQLLQQQQRQLLRQDQCWYRIPGVGSYWLAQLQDESRSTARGS